MVIIQGVDDLVADDVATHKGQKLDVFFYQGIIFYAMDACLGQLLYNYLTLNSHINIIKYLELSWGGVLLLILYHKCNRHAHIIHGFCYLDGYAFWSRPTVSH